MTWEQVFNLGYKSYARVMNKFAERMGREKLLNMLEETASEVVVERTKALLPLVPRRDLATFALFLKNEPVYRHALVFNIVEESAAVFEIHVSQCLWAKAFRAQNAGDIGYAAICHADYVSSTTYNPKMELRRTKTLMQGDDYCNHRWVMGA